MQQRLENGRKEKEIWSSEHHLGSRQVLPEGRLGEQVAPVTSYSMVRFKLLQCLENYLDKLTEEHLNMQLPFSKLFLANAIGTMKKGIAQYKAAFYGKRTCINPDMQQSLSSQNLKPCQQQEVGHNQREGWSAELHEKFLCFFEQTMRSKDVKKQIRELMKVDEFSNHEMDVVPFSQMSCQQTVRSSNQQPSSTKQEINEHEQSGRRKRKVLTVELCKKFRDCVERLGGPAVATLEKTLEAMEDPTLTIDDINDIADEVINWDDYDL